MNIIALIVEDEWAARDELMDLLAEQPDIVLCPPAASAREAMERMAAHQPHVIFLDVHMPGGSGIQVARHAALTRDPKGVPLVVFTTAYDEYAIDAFDVEAIDYLLKPYDPQRVAATLSRIRQRLAAGAAPPQILVNGFSTAGSTGVSGTAAVTASPAAPVGIRLMLAGREGFVVVPPHQIRFALRAERWVELHTDRGVLSVRTTLQELSDRLQGLPFFRCHRSCLINLHRIASVRPWVNGAYTIVMDDPEGTELPVSRHAARALFDRLRQFMR
ncbi:LytR/AlgR family response regulator transcription factor [Alicyclobacillus macrosporangiidus]|uniref:LytR/AlgR family response regulator transcription factor n=1 Tax=Alicyclobacillus macrosporangiidus TaxID=392015 RepID=UPI000497C2E0|nr:LytTR family DNA-binding domain-containing protein [Alicyclobacillus macrosporangiidus]